MIRCVEIPARASDVVVALARRLEHDADLAGQLNDASGRRGDASEPLWDGPQPGGLAALNGEHPGAIRAGAATGGCSDDVHDANVHELAAAAGRS